MSYVYIILGAALGAPLRYFVGSRLSSDPGGLPWGTFVVNASGCLAIGVVLGLAEQRDFINRELRLLLVTGFLGGYTTFSAFGWETYDLLRDGQVARALAYAVASVIVGVLAVWAGSSLVKAL